MMSAQMMYEKTGVFHNPNFNWDGSIAESIPKLKQVTQEGGRYYTLANEGVERNQRFFSVTTMLGSDPAKQKSLNEWRNRVGASEAKRVSAFSSGRGTKVHDLLESYVRGKEIESASIMPHLMQMFKSAIEPLSKNITKVYCLEQRLFSPSIALAGTADGVIEWNGVPAILDFKTSAKLKKKEWITDYFLQCTAYSLMWKELTGMSINDLVVFIMVDGRDEPQVFTSKAETHLPMLLKRTRDYFFRSGHPMPQLFAKN